MRSKIVATALNEWHYWIRSKLAISVIVMALLLTFFPVVVTHISISDRAHHREQLQNRAHQAFVSQPDRHPHRMVHYGHYVFRTPSVLAAIDPGLDTFTGSSVFLEGHRQNSAMFAQQEQSTGLTRFARLTPAFVVQVLMPLLLILLGYNSLTREKEGKTLHLMMAQGVSGVTILGGKLLSLVMVSLLILSPLLLASLLTLFWGEAVITATFFSVAYILYAILWCLITVLVSWVSSTSSMSFYVLISAWMAFCLIIPRIASTTGATLVHSPGKIETDFSVIERLRQLGDGHNSADPAFNQLKQQLLKRYGVERVEELPVNFKGIVAKESEAELTQVLNEFSQQRMDEELAQSQIVRSFGWISPLIAIRNVSSHLAGTGLETHHRFLREAEKTRFAFVQSLNTLQAEKVSYHDDTHRSQNEETAKRTRVDASNWQLLQNFSFTPDPASQRLSASFSGLGQLLVWILILLVLSLWLGRRVQ